MTSPAPQVQARPDLHSYHVVAISTSGGKDSQAMFDHVVALCRSVGYQGDIVAIHADLGDMEWEGTTDLVREQCAHYAVPLYVVSRPQGDLLTQVEQRGMWPSSKCRYCTSDHKRAQIWKVYTQLTEDRQTALEMSLSEMRNDPLRILECVGLRAEESPARSRKPVFEEKRKKISCGIRQVDTWLPIHDWTEEQVWDTIHESKVPYHHAYDLGMPRLSCAFCIFAPESALLLAGKHNPQLLQRYVDVERRIGHTFGHPSKKEQERYAAQQTALEDRKCSLAYIQAKLQRMQGEEITVENWRM